MILRDSSTEQQGSNEKCEHYGGDEDERVSSRPQERPFAVRTHSGGVAAEKKCSETGDNQKHRTGRTGSEGKGFQTSINFLQLAEHDYRQTRLIRSEKERK